MLPPRDLLQIKIHTQTESKGEKNIRPIAVEGCPKKYLILLLKIFKFIKNREMWRNCHSQEMTKET